MRAAPPMSTDEAASAMYQVDALDAGGTAARATASARARTDGFDAREMQFALEASTKETSADVLAVELEFDAADAAGKGRGKGQSLASKFWISQALDADEVLDETCDGFYDVWGDAFESSVDGQLPALGDLLKRPPVTATEEVFVVDRRTDMFLNALDELARETCSQVPNVRARCAALARLVSDRLGGSVKTIDDPTLVLATAEDREQLLNASSQSGCCLHVGHLSKGVERHRAILFKTLAASAGVPCRLVRGEYYCGRNSARVIFAEEGSDMWVDLMLCPGTLKPCSEPDFDGAPPTPPPYTYTHSRKEPTMSSMRADKGKSPLEKLPKSPLATGSNSSIDDLVSFARGTQSQAAAATTPAREEETEFLDDSNAELISAIAIAHGVALKSAQTAFKLAENGSERANLLCNALGAVLEDDAAHSRGLGEPVLLQEVFNMLVSKKWIVSDAVGAILARRREEIDAQALIKAAEQEEQSQAQRRRREEQKAKAAEDLIKAAESRVATFREARESRHEEEQSTDSIREEFIREWETKVASLNLAETLECFGVAVEGGAHANAKQLRSAYRKALLRFHPDRQGAKELRERVAAEERFKILSQKMEQG